MSCSLRAAPGLLRCWPSVPCCGGLPQPPTQHVFEIPRTACRLPESWTLTPMYFWGWPDVCLVRITLQARMALRLRFHSAPIL